MNFIYSILFFALMFFGAIIGKTFVDPGTDTYTFFVSLQWILSIVSIIFVAYGFFLNMSVRQCFLELKNQLLRRESSVKLLEDKYKELQEQYQKYLAEQYPALEKEIFGNIASNQPKELAALLQAYPELKSSVVLNNMMDNVTSLVSDVYHAKQRVIDLQEEMNNMKINGWYFKGVFKNL